MNTFEFFNEYLGQHLVEQTGNSYADAAKALSSGHLLVTGKKSRLGSGWAIVKPGQATVQLKLAATGIHYDDRTRFQAIGEALDTWSGDPAIFMTFDKAPLPADNLFLTVDLRAVRICTPAGVQTFDYLKDPTEHSPQFHRTLFKQRQQHAS